MLQSDELKGRLEELIKHLIENEGVTHFIARVALGIDTYEANTVLNLKAQYLSVTLECAIPCETKAVKWNEIDRDIYLDQLTKCDKQTLLQQNYTSDCMQKK